MDREAVADIHPAGSRPVPKAADGLVSRYEIRLLPEPGILVKRIVIEVSRNTGTGYGNIIFCYRYAFYAKPCSGTGTDCSDSSA